MVLRRKEGGRCGRGPTRPLWQTGYSLDSESGEISGCTFEELVRNNVGRLTRLAVPIYSRFVTMRYPSVYIPHGRTDPDLIYSCRALRFDHQFPFSRLVTLGGPEVRAE